MLYNSPSYQLNVTPVGIIKAIAFVPIILGVLLIVVLFTPNVIVELVAPDVSHMPGPLVPVIVPPVINMFMLLRPM